ncbi:uncharacterized protein LOC109813618 [Cajanus cajan]|uniref:DUF674 family protein n=1 Tax=Cajanus cajan TaxID=3821 RepID=A0A151U812_CAJCA|nr:uncharacterized protein LOC109813618 [Cajanus cajan]KYP75434.1 hypothetical protein KK1_008162 [Cajanus cajan]
MASSSTKLSVKLLIDSKRQKVLFAEASKEVTDFLFNLLRLPLSTVIRLLSKDGMVGCLGNLYQSVENLSDTYMQPNQCKDVLLKTRAPVISALLPSKNDCDDDNLETSFYTCPNNGNYNNCGYNVTCDNQTRCPRCNCAMSKVISYVGNKVAEDVFRKSGYVKEVVTYMVMDDLVIQPMSTISSITLLNKFNIKEVGALEEKVVELGITQGVNILKASLQSKMVLTSVFLKNITGS